MRPPSAAAAQAENDEPVDMDPIDGRLTTAERSAAHEFIRRVRRWVPADLVQASLFGSKARASARPDSDVDVLLVFRRLSWDREPHATHAEEIAESVALESGVPITTWTVSLPDLDRGNRTPMLVDAMEDSIPLWCAGPPLPPVPFTPDDALWCMGALQARIREGSDELAQHLFVGDLSAAARRVRDDLVRAGTALLLSRGITRPRRAEVVDAVLRLESPSLLRRPVRTALAWAGRSYGPEGRDEEARVAPPPDGLRSAARAVECLRREAGVRSGRLRALVEGT